LKSTANATKKDKKEAEHEAFGTSHDLWKTIRMLLISQAEGILAEDRRSSTAMVRTGFTPRDIEMQDAPTIVTDDEKAIEHAEGDRRNSEEVHRGNRSPVIAEKGKPALGQLRISRCPFHPTRDRSLRNIKTEHEKLAMNAWRSPRWVLNNHPENQFSNFVRCLSSPDGPPDFGDQLPVQAESCLVPTHHGFGRDRNEGLLPSGPESADGDPEELIEEAEDRPWTAPLQHRELLPEREILQEEMPTTAQRANKRSEPDKKQIEHGPGLYQINDREYRRMLLILQSARILANHRRREPQRGRDRGLPEGIAAGFDFAGFSTKNRQQRESLPKTGHQC